MNNEYSTSWKDIVRAAAWTAAAIAFAAVPAYAQKQPLAAASCPVPSLLSAPVAQYASFLPGAPVVSSQESAPAVGSQVKVDVQSEKPSTADRILKMRDVSGRPVSVQNAEKGAKEMVYLDKVSTAPTKIAASTLERTEGSEECTELGLVYDPAGPVACSDSLMACWETYTEPCTDAPGIPEDTYCAHWECRWW